MKNMKVSLKLITSFLLVAILAGAVGIVGIIGLNMLNSNEEGMYKQSVTANNAAMALRNIQAQRAACRGAAIKQVLGMEYEAEFTTLTDLGAEFDAYAMALENALTLQENIDRLAEVRKSYAEYVALRDPFMDAVRRNDTATLTEVMKKIGVPLDIVVKDITAISESALQVVSDRNINDGKTANSLITLMIAVVIIAVGVAIFLAVYISRLISKPLVTLNTFMKKAGGTGDIALSPEDIANIEKLGQIRDEIGQTIGSTASFVKHITNVANSLETIANGDLSVELTLLSESDTMGLSLQKMVNNLNKMFVEINSASAQVTIGSKQIADGAQSLAQGSTEQASAVQQLSASIADIAEKTKENATMATRAAALATTIMGNAEKGSQQMDAMMDAVKEINHASQNISKVIKVIDDIAFQTNILALNAAVEAARAGQHGKGFAVVAEEVRSLAAKSAEAAKETGGLIANSMEKAELGSRIAGETAQSLSEIVSGINESTKIVGDIAHSSDEQALAIQQVNTGIDQVAQVVQQNSATAEESAAASEEMSGQSNALEELISQFKLKDTNMLGRALPPSSHKRLNTADSNNITGGGMGKY